MTLVDHARRELELCGQTESDPAYSASLVAAIAALSSYGHSGGSMGAAIHQLTELLQFRPLSPLTPDPDEWLDLTGPVTSGAQLWQNRRDSAVFSINGGKTWYYVDGREPGPTL